MNKIEFNKMEIAKQIEYINNKLKEGAILSVVCEDIGISRSTVSARFNREGFKYNKYFRQYISLEEFGAGYNKSNKELVEEAVTKEGLVMCCCSKDIEKLPKKDLDRVIDVIGYGSSSTVYMNFDDTDYIVEVSQVDDEVDIWLITRAQYEDIYGEIYEEDWEWGLN